MPNMTLERDVVKRLGAVEPVPNYDLVVYDALERGKRIRAVIPPGGEFVRPLWEKLFRRKDPPVACAVSRDSNLRHDFFLTAPSAEEVEDVNLNIVLHFSVMDPRALVEGLDRDPITRLERETGILARRALSRIPWAEIEGRKVDLEHAILQDKSTDDSGVPKSHFEILRDFAASLGLKLQNVRVSWRLPEKVVAPPRGELDKERERRVTRLDHEIAKEKEALAAELELEREQHRHESQKLKEELELQRAKLELKREEHHQELQALKEELELQRSDVRYQLEQQAQRRKLLESQANLVAQLGQRAVNALGTAMDNTASGIQDATELKRAVQEIRSVQGDVQALTAGTEVSGLHELPAAGVGQLTNGPGKDKVLRELAQGLFELVEDLDSDGPERRRLLSRGLHVLAEAMLLEEADDDLMATWADDVNQEFLALVDAGALSNNEQRELLKLLQDSEALRAKLSKDVRR